MDLFLDDGLEITFLECADDDAFPCDGKNLVIRGCCSCNSACRFRDALTRISQRRLLAVLPFSSFRREVSQ